MQSTQATVSQSELHHVLIDAIKDKKGEEIISLDLRNITDAVTDCFIICHATSSTQVKAIAEHLTETTKLLTGEYPWHKEGFKNLEWVLIDYFDIVIHIFIKEKRTLYNLEELWSDAPVKHFDD